MKLLESGEVGGGGGGGVELTSVKLYAVNARPDQVVFEHGSLFRTVVILYLIVLLPR